MSDFRADSGRHQINIGHLVMGIALLGLVGVWALWQTEAVSDQDVHWLLPIPWVAAGLAGLVTTAITGPRRHAVRQAGWAGDQTEPAYRSVTDRLGDLSRLSDLKRMGERAAPDAAKSSGSTESPDSPEPAVTQTEETAPLFTQPAETPDDEERKP